MDEHYENLTQQVSAVGSDIKALKVSFERHHEEDVAWKTMADPVIQMGKAIQGFSTTVKVIAYAILTFAAIMGSIWGGIEWLRRP